jgi:hypothetical protein
MTTPFGPTLTENGYHERIRWIQTEVDRMILAGMPEKIYGERLARLESDAWIDFKIGQAFPLEKRDAVFAIRQRLRSRHSTLLNLLSGGWWSRLTFMWRLDHAAARMVDELADVLTPEELESLTGFPAGIRPHLGLRIRWLGQR